MATNTTIGLSAKAWASYRSDLVTAAARRLVGPPGLEPGTSGL